MNGSGRGRGMMRGGGEENGGGGVEGMIINLVIGEKKGRTMT